MAAACGGSGSSSEITSGPIRHMEIAVAVTGPDLESSAVAYVRDRGDELGLGLSAGDELQVVSVATRDGLRHVRMAQTYLDVPVFGGEFIVHADDSTFLGFNGVVTRNLDGFDVTPSTTSDEALVVARSDHAAGASVSYRREAARLVILPKAGGGADLAWQVELLNAPAAGLKTGRWHYFVSARDGSIIRKFDGLTTAEQASGPGGNPKVTRSWTSELDVEPSGAEYIMDSERMVTYDLENGTVTPAEAAKGPLDPIGDAEINDAHGYTEITLDMMMEWMGVDSIDGAGYKIKSQVHYDVDYDNAHWDGEFVAYGDGAEIFYPASGSLDVVAHEMNHGFTEFHSNLVYDDQSGGLNESFSDIAGTLAEFYEEGEGADWEFGEDTNIADQPIATSATRPRTAIPSSRLAITRTGSTCITRAASRTRPSA